MGSGTEQPSPSEGSEQQALTDGPDLIESAVGTPPTALVIGQTFTGTDTVSNIGTLDATATYTKYYLSTTGVSPQYLLGNRAVGAISAGGFDSGSATLTVPVGTPAGTYHLVACADSSGGTSGRISQVAETNENNNCSAATGNIALTGPDLIETAVSTSPANLDIATGTLTVLDTVVNNGAADAGSSITRWWLSTDQIKDPNDGFIRNCINGGPTPQRSVGAIGAGLSSVGSGTTTPLCVRDATGLHSPGPGTYYVIACADTTNLVGETNESNNCAVSSTTLVLTLCGNGILEAGEACDDGNTVMGDGCSNTCQIETVVSIAISPTNPTITKSQTQTFTAQETLNDGYTADVTSSVAWSSGTLGVATMAANVATGVGVGTSTISATLGGVTGTTLLTVNAAPLVSIAVTTNPNNPTNSIAKGNTQQYKATGTYADATTADITSSVTWASSSGTVASISTGGLAKGLLQGTTTISASYNDPVNGTITGSIGLTVTDPVVTGVVISPLNQTINKSTTLQFSLVATYSDLTTKDVTSLATWTSSDATAATISTSGLATGVCSTCTSTTNATTTITGAYSGFSDNTTLTVTNAGLTTITVAPTTTIAPGTTQQMTATANFNSGPSQDITSLCAWSSQKTTVATVDSTGLATAVAAGNTRISCTWSGKTGAAVLTVNNAVLQSIAITPANPTVPVGYKTTLTATGTFFDSTTNITSTQDITSNVTWSSSNTAVASVPNNQGSTTANGAGTSTIGAAFQGKTGTTTFTGFTATLLSISVTPSSQTISVGTSVQLTATGTFTGGFTFDITKQCSWTTNPTKVVSVSSNGKINAVKTGTTSVTATLSNVSGSATVIVQ